MHILRQTSWINIKIDDELSTYNSPTNSTTLHIISGMDDKLHPDCSLADNSSPSKTDARSTAPLIFINALNNLWTKQYLSKKFFMTVFCKNFIINFSRQFLFLLIVGTLTLILWVTGMIQYEIQCFMVTVNCYLVHSPLTTDLLNRSHCQRLL